MDCTSTVDYTLEETLCEETNGKVFQFDEGIQDGAVHGEKEACDNISRVGGVALGDNLCGGETSESFCCVGQCAYDCGKVEVLSSVIEGPSVATDLCDEESRAITEECCRCEGIYELNEELTRKRCGRILEDTYERVSLEEGVVEELIFFSDDEDEADEVSGGVLDGSRTKD